MRFREWLTLVEVAVDINTVVQQLGNFYGGGVPDQLMSNLIYHFITQNAGHASFVSNMMRTDPSKYQQYNGAYKQILQMVTAHLTPLGWTQAGNPAWIEWYRGGVTTGTKTGGMTSKRYVTVNPEDWYDVLRSLPVLARHLQPIKTTPGSDVIGFKVPTNFGTFLQHKDNIVIHFYDAAAIPQIDAAVQQYMTEIRRQAGNRAAMGRVDFGKDAQGTSDSDLVAQQVVRNLRANQRAIEPLLASNPAQAARVVQNMITQISQNASHRQAASPAV